MPARNRDTGSYGHPHRQAVAKLWAAHIDGQPCPRCGRPTYRDPLRNWDGRKLHGDHVGTPRVLGPDGMPDALSHARCNLRHGARLGNRMRGARRHMPARRSLPQW
jgi:hypothetical protein